MRMSLRPPASTSMRMRVAPASREFSRSSLTTEAGRSTTSPAAIWFATRSDRMRMRPMFLIVWPPRNAENGAGLVPHPNEGGNDDDSQAEDRRVPDLLAASQPEDGQETESWNICHT